MKKHKEINFDILFASMKQYTESIESKTRIFPLKWFKHQSHISLQILKCLVNYIYMTEIEKETFKIYNILKEKAIKRREEKSKRF